ncbi:putative defense protein 3 [Protopterus annectens]|uniref:putative defense protein 3 n=1 Tax=Protopterus annectens TaxID=7888 RepID=UPI001CFB4063|nr:putative defense protein 3 [Protopterus annectens]
MARTHAGAFFYFTILQVLRCNAFGNGAPESACESMLPGHKGYQPQPSPSPYNISVSAKSFKNGQPINVTITGQNYQGLLLEARMYGIKSSLGSWMMPPLNTKFLKCSGNPKGAITHSNTEIKTASTVYTWMPPETNCPPVITFKATVAKLKSQYWVNLTSEVLWRDQTATCGAETFTWSIITLLLLLTHIIFIYND